MQIDGDVLIGYTDWERQKWHDWLEHQSEALKTSMGPHGDNQTVGDVVKQFFLLRSGTLRGFLTNRSPIPPRFRVITLKPLFKLGQQSRQGLKDFIESFQAPNWDMLKDFEFVGWSLKATPRKIIIHVLTHEIGHWAQIATVLRLNGFKGEFHDFIFSPVLGGEFRTEQATASR